MPSCTTTAAGHQQWNSSTTYHYEQLQKHPPFVVTWISEAIRCKMSVVRFTIVFTFTWLTRLEINVHYGATAAGLYRINLAFVSWTRTNYNGLSYLLFAVVLLLLLLFSMLLLENKCFWKLWRTLHLIIKWMPIEINYFSHLASRELD